MTTDESFLSRRAEGRVGAVLRGKWRIDRLLGVGGMAAVYAGTHRNGKRGATHAPSPPRDELPRARAPAPRLKK